MIEKVNNIDEILSLIKNYFPQYSFNKTYEKVINYRIGDERVAFISYSIIYERAELNYIAVITKYRRRGIAQKLFEYLVDDLKNNMVKNLSLEVNVNNESAVRFYLKNGFKIESIRKKYYGNDDAYLMVLEVK